MKHLLDIRTFILALILTAIGVGYTVANVVVIPLSGEESGRAQAGAHVTCDSPGASVIRFFNNRNSAEVTASSFGNDTGRCKIDFGFDLANRYWVASTYNFATPAFVSCGQSFPTELTCTASTKDGFSREEIFLIVY